MNLNSRTFRRMPCCVSALLLWFCVNSTFAANVNFSVDARESYVGSPVTLSIAVVDAQSFDRPQLPEIQGASVQRTPEERTLNQTSIINGRASSSTTVTLTYRITPTQAGTLTIPSITLTADGQKFASQPIDISVVKSETGDLLFVELQADKSKVYFGQSLQLTLQIWIKQYQDRQYNYKFNESDTWSLINFNASDWGDFKNELIKQRDPFGRWTVQGRLAQRADADDIKRSYWLYELTTTVWPSQAGPLVVPQPSIAMQYPLRLARKNDFFSSNLAISEAKPISAVATFPQVEVLAPPSAGQPPTFSGAVGQFDIAVSAKPTDVAVGDPITLTINVIDRTTNGGTRLEQLAPPALDRVGELADNFKIPKDPLAGTVSGRTKTFTQTIRPKSDQVNRIPPIPLAFFDPDSEQYVTRNSNAISISVKPASQLALNDIVQSPTGNSGPTPTELKESAGGILANDGDIDVMLINQQLTFGLAEKLLLFLPPALFLALSTGRMALRFRTGNPRAMRRRQARRRAEIRLDTVKKAQACDQAQLVSTALCDYVADRLDQPAGTLTRDDVLNLLRERKASEEDVLQVDRLLNECEQLAYAGGSGAGENQLSDRAAGCIDRLERSRLS